MTETHITFLNGKSACFIQVDGSVDLSVQLQQIGLKGARPTLVVVGGASKISEEVLSVLNRLFLEVLAPLAEEIGAYVVDGGTDAGVMQMMGQARTEIDATFPLIGVAPIGKIGLPNALPLPTEKPLEPNHTHFLLVPGSAWGDGSPWIAKAATVLAGNLPSLMLLINGGEATLLDLIENVKAERPVVVIAGSGRLADEVTKALDMNQDGVRDDLVEVLQLGQISLLYLSYPLPELLNILRQKIIKEN